MSRIVNEWLKDDNRKREEKFLRRYGETQKSSEKQKLNNSVIKCIQFSVLLLSPKQERIPIMDLSGKQLISLCTQYI